MIHKNVKNWEVSTMVAAGDAVHIVDCGEYCSIMKKRLRTQWSTVSVVWRRFNSCAHSVEQKGSGTERG